MQNSKLQLKTKNDLKRFEFLAIIFIFSFLVFNTCQAAKLYLEPAEGQYQLGDTFIVEMKINTEEEDINVVEATLIFSYDVLEVKDFSRGNSILTLWVKEPAFSNQAGTVSFSGGIPHGYQGDDGIL